MPVLEMARFQLHHFFVETRCVISKGIVWRNFSILGPKLVLAYAEDVLSDSVLKNCAKCKSG